MRTRLAYTLSFWLLGAVALSVLAMGRLTAWNLRQGFSAYLQARDIERFDKIVALVAGRLAKAGRRCSKVSRTWPRAWTTRSSTSRPTTSAS